MSKRANTQGHVRREEYDDNGPDMDGPPDPMRKATAAQLAKRTIKTPKRRLAPGSSAGAPSGVPSGAASTLGNPFASGLSTNSGTNNATSIFNFGQQSTPSVSSFTSTAPTDFNFGKTVSGFGASATSNNTPNVFGSQPQQNQPPSSGGGLFGSGTQSQGPSSSGASNLFSGGSFGSGAQPPAQNNLFGNQSFSGFGASNNSTPSTPGNLFTNSSFPPASGENTAVGANTPAPDSTPNKGFNFISGNNASLGSPSTPFGFGNSSKDAPSNAASTPFPFGSSNKDATAAPASTAFDFAANQPATTPAATSSTPFPFGGGNKDVTPTTTPMTNNFFSAGTGTQGAAAASSPAPSNPFNKPSTFSNIMKEVTGGDATATSNIFGNLSSKTPNNDQKDTGFAPSVSAFGAKSSSGETDPPTPAFGGNAISTSTPPSSVFSKSAMPAFGNKSNDTSSTPSQNPFAQSSFSTFGNQQNTASSSLFNTGQAAPQPASNPPPDSNSAASAPQSSFFGNFAQSQPANRTANDSAAPSAQNSNSSFGFAQSQPAPSQSQHQFGASTQSTGHPFAQTQSVHTPIHDIPTDPASIRSQVREIAAARDQILYARAEVQRDYDKKVSELKSVQDDLKAKEKQLRSQASELETRHGEIKQREQVCAAERDETSRARNFLETKHAEVLDRENRVQQLETIVRQREDRVHGQEARLQQHGDFKVSPSNNTDTDSAATPAPTSDAYPIPPIPKAYLTQEMKDQRPNITNIDSNLSDIDKQLVKYCAELKSLNHALKLKIANLVEIADWSSLTKWHAKETKELMAKIKETKQERARLNGVTGAESALSSKRKATDDAEQTRHTATPKKARAFAPSQESAVSYTPKADPPASNTAQKSTSFGFTPTATPASKDTSQTSNLFGNILSKPTNSPLFPSAPTTDSPKAASSPFGSSQPAAAPSSAKPSVSESAAGFKPSTPSGFQPSVAKDSPAPSGSKPSGFQPSTTKDRPASSGFKPSGFQASSSVSGSSMVNAFAQQAKSAEQLAAERKKKAKDEEYDSDEETYEEWSARYDREQAAKKEEEAKKPQTTQAFKGFSLSTAASTASSPFNASRNASGTTSIFTSGAASPAHSANGGLSVFDTPSAAPSPGSNIFGHLSSNASSNNQDDSDEEEQDEEEEEEGKAGQSKDGDATAKDDTQASKPSLFSRISYGPPAGQAEDEDASAKDDTKTSKPSLLSRITRDPPAAEASNADVNATVETPKNKFQFDFANAGAKTAPPKPSTFAGDQTWKPGTKINFGSSISDAGTANMPLFNLQPATPSSSGAGTKAVPFSLFSNSAGAPSKPSFLAPGAAQSGPGSVASSVFSSRATTPLSDAGASDPGAADDETPSGPQLDLSDLTEEEKKEHEVLFHTKLAIAKEPSGEGKDKQWKNVARGALWILKNKESGKALVRMRLPSGATPINFNILPRIASRVAGNSKTMILTSRPLPDGKITSMYLVVKTPEEAAQFSSVFDANMPQA